MKRYIFPTILSVLASSCLYAQTKVTSGVMHGKDYGITYMLPKTEIVLQIEESHYEYTPGEFSAYAEKYLYIPDVKQEKTSYWSIDKVQLYTLGIPDKDKVYFVKMKDKTVAPLMQLTKDGIIKAINVANPINDNIIEPLKTSDEKETVINPYNYLTEEILAANSKAKMAELTAKEIYSIKESINSLLKGEADNMPKDGNQLQLMLTQLQTQENALKQLFTGKVIKKSNIITLMITPEEMDKKIICRFSSVKGIVEADDLIGQPIYMTLSKLNTPDMSQSKEDNKKKEKTEGIVYNLPGRAKVLLEYKHQTLVDKELSLTQFGDIEYLTPVLFDKKSTIQITFNTTTGAILQVNKENNE